jgi:putative effector of murein hydrolase
MTNSVAANVNKLWVYLSESALLWLAVTFAAFMAANAIFELLRRNPIANPQPIAAGLICGILVATGTSYPTYFAGAQFVHFLLGPATVALAVPCIGICRKFVARLSQCWGH